MYTSGQIICISVFEGCQNRMPYTEWLNRDLFLIVLEAGSPRSRCQQGWFLLRPLSLACRWLPSSCNPTCSFLCVFMPLLFLCASKFLLIKRTQGSSLVAQWLRIHLPTQGTRVRTLLWEDPTCCRATKPARHNYWAWALEPTSYNYWAHEPQLLRLCSTTTEACA